MLNAILNELAETQDFDIMKVTNYTLITQNVLPANGPYPLPSNYLRASQDELNYVVNGTVYKLKQMPIAEYRSLYQGPGISNYPEWFATDMSTTPPSLYLWPPPSGAFSILIPYFKSHADITNPQTSSVIPWFPGTTWLYRRLSSDLMLISDDTRQENLQRQSKMMLGEYLEMKDDPEGYSKTVKLDSRRFRGSFNNLKATKQTGW